MIKTAIKNNASLRACGLVLATTFTACALLFGGAQNAYASDVHLSKVDEKAHNYQVFQVFKGTVEDGQLANIEWGSGINGESTLQALRSASAEQGSPLWGLYSDSTKTAAQVYETTQASSFDVLKQKRFAINVGSNTGNVTGTLIEQPEETVISGLEPGVYLVRDTACPTYGYGSTGIPYIVEFTTNDQAVYLAFNEESPTANIKVKENIFFTADEGFGVGFNKAADYDFGSVVPCKLIGDVADHYADYEQYPYTFHLLIAEGLAFGQDAVVVMENDGATTDVTNFFEVTQDGGVVTISCANLKVIPGVTGQSRFVVDYTATLEKNASVGVGGTYSSVYLEAPNDPAKSGQTGAVQMFNSDYEQADVFTYALSVTNKNGDGNNVLAGSQFVVKNEAGNYAQADENGAFTAWVADDAATKFTTDSAGVFNLKGIEGGTYYLEQVSTPEGITPVGQIKVQLTPDLAASQSFNGHASEVYKGLTFTVTAGQEERSSTGDVETGTVSITVANNAKNVIPVDGNQTVFDMVPYIVGGAVLFAVVLVAGGKIARVMRNRQYGLDK